MDPKKRALVRIAMAVQDRLLRSRTEPIKLPHQQLKAIRELMDRATFCRDRGMCHAEHVVRDDLRWHFNHLSQEAHAEAQAIAEAQTAYKNRRKPTSLLADIYNDLVALDKEFAAVAFDLRDGVLSVTTQPIVLSEVELGPFRIDLKYRRICEYQPYRVVAVQPNYPPGYPDVTHPHVKDDSLCEGDAIEAIKSALKSGRLYDFFLIVAQVLSNLGDSPHVSISRWNNTKCEDCGDAIAEDEALVCSKCSIDLCGNCSSWCPHCETDYCSSCNSICDACDGTCCQNCLTKCPDCEQSVCPNCDKGKMCACRIHEEPNENEKVDEEASPGDAQRDQEVQLAV